MDFITRAGRRSPARALTLAVALATFTAVVPGGVALADRADICPAPDADDDAFADDDGTAHEASIDCVAGYGIASGFQDGSFGPNVAITRDQMASFIVAYIETALDRTLPAGGNAFDDDDGNTHEANIDKLAAAGIVSGFGPRAYGPRLQVTREQMSSFIAAATEYILGDDLPVGSDAFDDDDGRAHEANTNKLANAGIVQGYGGRQYRPIASVIRGQMAAYVINAAVHLHDEGAWSPVPTPPASPGSPTDGTDSDDLPNTPTSSGKTSRPELIRGQVAHVDTLGTDAGTTIRFTFDEAVEGPDMERFFAYSSGTDRYEGTRASLVSTDSRAVDVYFSAIDTQAKADALTVATVEYGAVQDGSNTFNPIGDAPLVASSSSSSTLPAGITRAPDLAGVTFGDTVGDVREVLFRFDEDVATISLADRFLLVLTTGFKPIDCIAQDVSSDAKVVDAECEHASSWSSTDVARAVVGPGAVEDADGFGNVLQAVHVGNSGRGELPDLDGIAYVPDGSDPDQVVFTFDEPVTAEDPTLFFLYYATKDPVSPTGVEVDDAVGATKVVATFSDGALSGAVGAGVEAGAVAEAGGLERLGLPDEEGKGSSVTVAKSAVTDRPDLTGVKVSGSSSSATVTFTFDEDVVSASAASFAVYGSDGTAYTPAGACTTSDEVVTCADWADDAKVYAAVIGTVEHGGATDGLALDNPEGAAHTTR